MTLYHLSTFHFQKNERVNEKVAEGVSKDLPKIAMKLRKFSNFYWGDGGVAIFTKKINLNLKCFTTKKIDKQKYFSLS